MTSFSRVFCGRAAFGMALWACACERDSAALFDDSSPPASAAGGTPGALAGSAATAGDDAGGDDGGGGSIDAAGGSSAIAGSVGTTGGTATEGGTATGGGAGRTGDGGKAGSATAGGGAGGVGGTGGAGTEPDPEPEPVTIVIDDFDDSYVASCMPSLNFGKAATFNVDNDYSCVYQALLNPSLAELPEGAQVSKATLTLFCVNAGGEIAVSYASEAWKEDAVRWSSRPERGGAVGDLSCSEEGAVMLDLTAAVAAWVSGEQEPYGLYLRTETDDGTDFASSEASATESRPSLSVTYTPPKK